MLFQTEDTNKVISHIPWEDGRPWGGEFLCLNIGMELKLQGIKGLCM